MRSLIGVKCHVFTYWCIIRELLEKEHSGCRALLRDDKVDDLSRMYRLHCKIPRCLDLIANLFNILLVKVPPWFNRLKMLHVTRYQKLMLRGMNLKTTHLSRILREIC